MHVDNLYFDSNAIIHACVHANQVALQNATQQEMFERVFNYIDTVYKLVKPKNLVMIAVDGVAPRAKMNQQRARRFNAARDHEEFLENLQAQYGPQFSPDMVFDRNSISPGTPFMMSLLQAMREWLRWKCDFDPVWSRGPKVPTAACCAFLLCFVCAPFSASHLPMMAPHFFLLLRRTIKTGRLFGLGHSGRRRAQSPAISAARPRARSQLEPKLAPLHVRTRRGSCHARLGDA